MHDPTEPISVVEDLDPEPPARQGLGQRAELFVGLLVLVAALAFAGWQWWRQQVQVSSYAAGQTALANVDWDTALASFTQAGDYRDASQLADRARQQVATRNRLYASAQQHVNAHEWLEALSDLRAVALIQPTYRDLPAQQSTALQNVYTAALSGTVALRSTASPPGLYYYNGADWVYLQESDAHSHIMDTHGQDKIVYDAPAPCILPPAECHPNNPQNSKPKTQESEQTAPQDAGDARTYQLATLTSQGFTFSKLDIDSEHYSQIILNKQGAWGQSYDERLSYLLDSSSGSINPIARTNYVDINLVYQRIDGPVEQVQLHPVITAASGSDILMTIDPLSDRYLSVDYTNAHDWRAASDTTIKLYLGTAGSTERRLIYTHHGGGIQSAQLSQDGRWALANVIYLRANGAREKVASILIDLQGAQTPQTVQEATTGWSVPIGSAFVQNGAFAGDIIYYEPDNLGTRLLLVDPTQVGSSDNPQGIIRAISVEDQPGREWVLMNQHGANRGLLLMGQSGVSPSYAMSSTLSLVNIPVQGQPSVTTVRMPPNSWFSSIQVKGESAAWVTYFYPPSGASVISTSINMVALGNNSSEIISPTLVFTSTFDPISKNPNTTPRISLGNKLIAYSLDQQLHARTYSGSADEVLESGLSYVVNYQSEMVNPFWGLLR